MADYNSSISGTQSGGFTAKDKNLNTEIQRQSSIKSGATTKRDSGTGYLTDSYNPKAEKSQKTGDSFIDFFRNFSKGLSFENGVNEAVYDF